METSLKGEFLHVFQQYQSIENMVAVAFWADVHDPEFVVSTFYGTPPGKLHMEIGKVAPLNDKSCQKERIIVK